MRLLSKGADLPFVHKSVSWEEYVNFKDYDIVFANLRTLEEDSTDYDHPFNDSEDSPELFASSDVDEFVEEEGHMVVYMPESSTVDMGGSTTVRMTVKTARSQQGQEPVSEPDPYCEYNLLEWLPISLDVNSSEEGDSVEVQNQDWKWFFGNEFSWNNTLRVTATRGYEVNSIAENSYGKVISYELRKGGGTLSLLPYSASFPYSEFVKHALENVFGIESNVEGRAPPAWVSNYSLPNESQIETEIDEKREEIEELKSELNKLEERKRLLYETHTNLEDSTRQAFRDLGFTVEGEVPGKRDGILNTSQTKFVLEITGTTGGIKLKKCRQLDEWVENAIVEFPEDEVSGLLVVNPQITTSPNERDAGIEPNVEKYMERRGDYKIFTTPELYQIIEQNMESGVDTELVEDMLHQEETMLRLPPEFTQ